MWWLTYGRSGKAVGVVVIEARPARARPWIAIQRALGGRRGAGRWRPKAKTAKCNFGPEYAQNQCGGFNHSAISNSASGGG
jgi:hypothetical protein